MEHIDSERGINQSLSSTCGALFVLWLWDGWIALDNGMENVWSARRARATLYYTEFRG